MLLIAIAHARQQLDKAVAQFHCLERELFNWSDIWFHDEIADQEAKLHRAEREIHQWENTLGLFCPP